MYKSLLAVLLAFTLLPALADDKQTNKHKWTKVLDGGMQVMTIYVDELSIQKNGDIIKFYGSTQFPPQALADTFQDADGKEIKLSKPASAVYYRATVNCTFENGTENETTYFDTDRKLILKQTSEKPYSLDVDSDLGIMFAYVCKKLPKPKTDA